MKITVKLFNKVERCFVFRNCRDVDIKQLDLKDLDLDPLIQFGSILKTDTSGRLFVKILKSKYGSNSEKRLGFFFREIIAERLFLTIRSLREYRYTKKTGKNWY